MSRLPPLSMLPNPVILRGPRPLEGEIAVGEVFAWEPDLPDARELVQVTRITEGYGGDRVIWCFGTVCKHEVWNFEDRFREACHRTLYRPGALGSPSAPGPRDILPL